MARRRDRLEDELRFRQARLKSITRALEERGVVPSTTAGNGTNGSNGSQAALTALESAQASLPRVVAVIEPMAPAPQDPIEAMAPPREPAMAAPREADLDEHTDGVGDGHGHRGDGASRNDWRGQRG